MSIKQVLKSLNLGSIRRFLTSLYHREGRGRKPYPAVSMLKAQLLKHLWRVPSDRRLALLLLLIFYRAKDEAKLRHEMQCTVYKAIPFHEWIGTLSPYFRARYGELKQ